MAGTKKTSSSKVVVSVPLTVETNPRVVLSAAEIVPFIKAHRQLGKSIVLTQGSFDMVHIGHARYCEEAKKYGDVLIVGVDSDEKIRLRKGHDRPVVPQEERLEMLTYLRSVDHVVLKELSAPKWELIKLIEPDVLIATRETYTPAQLTQLKKWCKKIVVLEHMATTSTSAKIRRLQLGMAKKMSATLSDRLIATITDVLSELKGEADSSRPVQK